MLTYLILAVLTLTAAHILHNKSKTHALNKYPGPYLATWTNLWRFHTVITTMHSDPPPLITLHRTHGDTVRIGPNVLSFAQPGAVRDIYGTDKPYGKSEFYWTGAAVARGRPNPSLFSSLDGEWHDRLRRTVNQAFSLSALVQYEPYVSRTVETFVRELQRRFASTNDDNEKEEDGDGKVMDLPTWMHWYAFDVIGELTYGVPFGFLETASDVDGIIEKAHFYILYNQVIGQMPWLDMLLLKNPVLLWLNRRGRFNASPNPVVAFALKRQNHREQQRRQLDGPEKREEIADGRVDLLDKFLGAKEKFPDVVGDKEVLGMGLSMVLAGSESTAVTLSAIFYYLLKNPKTYRKLQQELDANITASDWTDSGAVMFRAAQTLPYLDACIKEAFRLHPAARFTPERVLPEGGGTVAGQHLLGGTIVGVNAWVLHRRQEIFGDQVDSYIPERWMSDDPEKQQRIAEMNRSLLHFGSGRFGCIGKNISLLEIYKVVPTLLLKFDFELKDPAAEWTFQPGSFMNVSGVDVRLKTR